mgnify:CR=1 FL=1
MFGKLKCNLGWHDWEDMGTIEWTDEGREPKDWVPKFFPPGVGYFVEGVLYSEDLMKCKRCGLEHKHQY